MKYSITLSAFLFFTGLNAQLSVGVGGTSSIHANLPTNNYNVGIGITNPTSELEINGTTKTKFLTLTGGLANGQFFRSIIERDNKSLLLNAGSLLDVRTGRRILTFYDFPVSNFNNQATVLLSIKDRGDVSRFLLTAAQESNSSFILNDKSGNAYFQASNNVATSYIEMPQLDSHFVIGGNATYPMSHALWVKNGTTKLEGDLLADSNVGIGTNSFTDGSDTFRLSVNGNIRAHRVKVYTTWADYVFENDYKLPTLKEVEQQINEKGHLIDIPSAKEVEEKGIELGEMNKLLLQKVEELTLYVIKMNKEIEALKRQSPKY